MGASGNFFAVDRRTWGDICSLKQINLAISYLVLARGTQSDMRTTSWSVNAIEDRTAIPRIRAKEAVRKLISENFIEQRKGGTKPQYYLSKHSTVQEKRRPARVLSDELRATLNFIKDSPDEVTPPRKGGRKLGWPTEFPHIRTQELASRGLVRWLPSGAAAAVDADMLPEADWIWLPNTIIDGIDGETPPIERVRQAHSMPTLRLYVDLYHAQALSIDGGVNWRLVRESYKRHKVGEWGNFDVYAFWKDKLHCWPASDFINKFTGWCLDKFGPGRNGEGNGLPHLWEAIETLRGMGLISFVPHAVTADSEEGTVIHPLARDGEGEEAEREVASAAHAAATVMLGLHRTNQTYGDHVMLLPVQRHIREVAVVGLIRLRHRANTSATAAWFERMDEWRDHAARLEAHEEALRVGEAATGRATSTGHQRGVKG